MLTLEIYCGDSVARLKLDQLDAPADEKGVAVRVASRLGLRRRAKDIGPTLAASIDRAPFLMVVNPSSPAKTVAEFIAYYLCGPPGSPHGPRCSLRCQPFCPRATRAYSEQVETLRRLRHGGDQYVRVEHVHINEGGQAMIGNMQTREGRREQSTEKMSDDHDTGTS
jgi:hypothetical protein